MLEGDSDYTVSQPPLFASGAWPVFMPISFSVCVWERISCQTFCQNEAADLSWLRLAANMVTLYNNVCCLTYKEKDKRAACVSTELSSTKKHGPA